MLKSVEFIKTPAAEAQLPPTDKYGVLTTDSPAIHNAPLPADGPSLAHFSNLTMASLVVGVPYLVVRQVGLGWKSWLFLTVVLALPLMMAYWTLVSKFSPRLNEKVTLPGRPISYYLKYHDAELKAKYETSNNGQGRKIPMETFIEAYISGKVTCVGDCLDTLEFRHDWCTFEFTLGLFKYFLLEMIPEVIFHSKSQDEEQVRDHYDRGDDFYTWFLGNRMIYTSGVIGDIEKEETLEQLQDNKLAVLAEKIDLKKGDHLLDLGCGWGTWAANASSVHGAKVTGVTLGKNQTHWGNQVLSDYGVSSEQSRIVCVDYRDTPPLAKSNGLYDKITCLEMSEHVGVRKLGAFLQQVYDSLEDDGLFFLQYAGLRKRWQYEDLNWGLFMNKYIFPGADASTPLTFYIEALESVGFEVVSIDNIGVHYSATLWRWYRNWLGNKDKVVNKYGIKWFKVWEYFLASSTIISRQGSATCYQIVLRKNLNSYPRVNYVPSQQGLQAPLTRASKWTK
ncbi:Sphingolipid C9-methyltransferase [Scheffersomyces spartinae]|uniref:sphingolipid C(9)-methyltransferase n=1 Tax=Scheffersomyces spartinae TaxID=45513 RepID=A0A9P7V6X3_9ASCO|nr:Sphingolipid C9-methyltransferase [Scheffersomyces spartinae]KAG7192394.1 Sphingolipid C9-methyltransferase [Scheffersomyces spartinae]